MPRRPREISPTSIYHAITRGINKSVLFFSDADRHFFLETLQRVKQEGEYELYAYCLMSNHVHLLLKAENDCLERVMKKILVRYAAYYNNKHDRIGHVFQDRFRSEIIDSEAYFLGCARYIHKNPVKAGIVNAPQNFFWSSYREYIEPKSHGLVDKEKLLGCYSSDYAEATKLLKTFTSQEDSQDEDFLEIHDDQRIEGIIQTVLYRHKIQSMEQIALMDKNSRTALILDLIKATGVTKRDLAKRIGVNKQVVYNAFTSPQSEQVQ